MTGEGSGGGFGITLPDGHCEERSIPCHCEEPSPHCHSEERTTKNLSCWLTSKIDGEMN